MDIEMVELTAEQLTQVSGGLLKGIGIGILTEVVIAGAKEFGGWAGRSAAGGADSGTWERIGASQMGA